MKKLFSLLILSLLTVSCGSRKGEKHAVPVKADGVYALKQAEIQAGIVPRHSGTPGAEKACTVIAREAEKLGYTVTVDEFTDESPEGTKTFRNVEAVLPGAMGDFVVAGAHYDAKKLLLVPDFQAANDGGSGVGALLAVMKALKENPSPLAVRFCFFDGEEALNRYTKKDGLHGSRHFVRKLKKSGKTGNCRCMILLDMVGDKELCIDLPENTPSRLRELALETARELGRPDAVRAGGPRMLDDHTPFAKAGIPAMDLIDFNYGPRNAYWHTAEDSMDKISAESLEFSASLLLNILRKIK